MSGFGGQVIVVVGGPWAWLNSAVHCCCQGQDRGRCRVSRRAEEAIRAGMLTILRRIVAVVALASPVPVMVAAARVRLKASTASTSQAALAVKTPEGRCDLPRRFRTVGPLKMRVYRK